MAARSISIQRICLGSIYSSSFIRPIYWIMVEYLIREFSEDQPLYQLAVRVHASDSSTWYRVFSKFLDNYTEIDWEKIRQNRYITAIKTENKRKNRYETRGKIKERTVMKSRGKIKKEPSWNQEGELRKNRHEIKREN